MMIQRLPAQVVIGLVLRKYFVFQGKTIDMGHLIATGFSTNGHKFDFVETNTGSEKNCLMVCDCGWSISIDSFQHSWSVIEVKIKVQEHLSKFGITTDHPAAIFDLEASD